MLENCQNNILMNGCSPIKGTTFYFCSNLMNLGPQNGTYVMTTPKDLPKFIKFKDMTLLDSLPQYLDSAIQLLVSSMQLIDSAIQLDSAIQHFLDCTIQ